MRILPRLSALCIVFLLLAPSVDAATRPISRTKLLRARLEQRRAQLQQGRRGLVKKTTATSLEINDRFSLTLPDGWKKAQGNAVLQNARVLAIYSKPAKDPQSFPPNANVVAETLPASAMSLQKYTAATLDLHHTTTPGFSLLSSETPTLSRLPGQVIVFTMNAGLPLTIQQAWTVKNGTAFVLTFTVASADYQAHAEMFQKMRESFLLQ